MTEITSDRTFTIYTDSSNPIESSQLSGYAGTSGHVTRMDSPETPEVIINKFATLCQLMDDYNSRFLYP